MSHESLQHQLSVRAYVFNTRQSVLSEYLTVRLKAATRSLGRNFTMAEYSTKCFKRQMSVRTQVSNTRRSVLSECSTGLLRASTQSLAEISLGLDIPWRPSTPHVCERFFLILGRAQCLSAYQGLTVTCVCILPIQR